MKGFKDFVMRGNLVELAAPPMQEAHRSVSQTMNSLSPAR
jgi:large-conductance mechanosensitive channel